MKYVLDALEWIMNQCYGLIGNYGFAIVLFTLISKIILLPISVWVQKNSIKMIGMQPEINAIKVRFFGDRDAIADEEHKLYKEKKYSPFAGLIPLVIQLLLLIGLIQVIRTQLGGTEINPNFFGINLSDVPNKKHEILILAPILAGLSSYLLCVVQNHSNVLQSEQSKANKYGTMIFSVGLSLYLGWFVPVGVAIYWVSSNLLSILQLYLMNLAINPRKYVDYEALEASKKELQALEKLGGGKKTEADRENAKREKQDYKRLFSVVNKHLVFYSESSGFYKYFRGVIEYLLKNTNLTIHYITSDPKDQIFELAKTQEKIRPYYIGEKKLITLMMKMDADVVVMTMPDLQNFHIKRSYVRKDIEYIFIPHSMCSLNLTMRKASIDHFDTIFCTGKHQVEETRKTEEVYGLPAKELVEWGYCLLDQMRSDYRASRQTEKKEKTVLVAPSWQKDNIVDSCLTEILDSLVGRGHKIIVRPHPQHVKHEPQHMEELKRKYAENPEIEIQTDFSSDKTVFDADMMITDWSGIAYEYSFTTYRPVLFMDTPVKIMNPEYEKLQIPPFNVWMREKMGRVLAVSDAAKAGDAVEELLKAAPEYEKQLESLANEYVYHLDCSGEVGAKYIIAQVKKQISKKKE